MDGIFLLPWALFMASGYCVLQPKFKHALSLKRDQILTALGFRRGYFVQYPYVPDAKVPVATYEAMEALCRASPFREFLEEIRGHVPAFERFGEDPNDPDWENDMFPKLDGAAAYAAVRKFRPKRIIEIGSGNSTHFLAAAAKGLDTEIICIDPKPRREIKHLSVVMQRRPMTDSDVDLCRSLNSNDILFIDGSHVLMPGTDVDIQFNRCFPALRPGVIVHIHDIFLPDDYPVHWRMRNYSEQNALIGWIISGAFEILYPGYYVLTREWDLIRSAFVSYPLEASVRSGSMWLRKR